MNDQDIDLSNPNSICGCGHLLGVHTFSAYQNMQHMMSHTLVMIPTNYTYTEWKCDSCLCKEFKVDNLRYLEQRYEQSKRD